MATPPTATPCGAGVPAPRRCASGHTGDVGDTDRVGVAWIVREVTHVPGVLRLHGGRLSFTSTRGVLFDETLDDLEVVAAWTPRAGFRVRVGGEDLRVRVVRPHGAVAASAELLERLAGEWAGPTTWGDVEAGPAWRALLSTRPERPRATVRVPGWPAARSRRGSGAPARTC